MNQVLSKFKLKEGETIEVGLIVEELFKRKMISYAIYELFITEERNSGNIEGVINNNRFDYLQIDCSMFSEENLPTTPEEEMYWFIYQIINNMINEK